MSYIKFRVGDIINGIKFLSLADRSGKRQRANFECPFCGNTFKTFVYNVSSGHATSCGCNSHVNRIKKITKHGHCSGGKVTTEYTSYREMLDRCYSSKNEEYVNYGGRGIYVCDRWKESYKNFLDDMGLKPDRTYSIERINNDGGYEPDNCKWATPVEQGNNTRRNVRITLNGETKTQSQWARHFGIPETTIRGRRKRGLPVEQILYKQSA